MDINEINDAHTNDEISISSSVYEQMVHAKADVINAFEEAVELYNQINKDPSWKGAAKGKYEDGKAFIDQFMNDLPKLFTEIDTQFGKISLLLDDLFSEVSKKVKEFETYYDD